MNSVKKQVIYCLNSAMRGKKVNLKKETNINWEIFIDELKAHKIESLMYSAMEKETINNIEKNLLGQWKKDTFQSVVYQLNHIRQVEEILKAFNDNDIDVMVLKGIVIREMYPRPELRTMCDADLLVHKEDLDKVRELLSTIGYIETEISDVHANFFRGSTHIEVHWIITKEHYFNEISILEQEIWKNAVIVKIGESKALSMANEDFIMHLCLHMASHLIDRGFGIRQVCDLVLFVEQRGEDTNWEEFLKKVKLCGIETFVKVIFNLSKELFYMEIPNELQCEVNKKLINELTNDIFSSGVHGKRDRALLFAKELAYDGNSKDDSVIYKYIKFLFPKVNQMSGKYDYAKKNKLLIPIAWLHHLCCGIFNKDYSVKDKVKFTTSSVRISQKRYNLIKELEL